MNRSSWRWARRVFLAAWAVGLVLWAWAMVRWSHVSLHLAGVSWHGPAWAAWVAAVIVFVDALMEMSPAPGTLRREIGEWARFFTLMVVSAVFFAVALWLILVLPRPLLLLFPFLQDYRWARILYIASFAGVFIGIFFLLGRLEEAGIGPAIRRLVRDRLLGGPPTQEEILWRLEAANLPQEEKRQFEQRIREKGLRPALIRELLAWVEKQIEEQATPSRAILAQTLRNWLEANERATAERLPRVR